VNGIKGYKKNEGIVKKDMIKLDIIFHKNRLRQLHFFAKTQVMENAKIKKLKTDVRIIIVILMCKKHKMFCSIPNFDSLS